MRNALIASLPLIAIPALAHAQTVNVRTLANGGHSTTISPGEIVSIRVLIAHPFHAVAGIQGGTIITGNAGVGQNFATTIPAAPIVYLGDFLGGSRVGADIACTPSGFLGGPPFPLPFTQNPMPVWSYDIAGLTPGVYEINWVSPTSVPNVRGYVSPGSFSFVEAQTTYARATITVIPTPATLAPLATALALTPRRRRQPALHAAHHTEGIR